jgi:photosystem II stability/assembly factor-like uncharacterized protein
MLLALPACRAPSFDAGVPGVPPEQRLLLLDTAHAGARLVAVGESGHIVYSDDAGSHWQRAQSPSTALLTAVYFVDAQHGWAVGHDMLILATTDGGQHWKQQFSAPQESRPLLDVWFKDTQRGYAVGAYGAMLVTTDGGKTWQAQHQTEDDHHLYAIQGFADGSLLLAGEAGTLRRSEDAGKTWRVVSTPYAGSFFGALQVPDGSLLLFGLRGHILRSTDQGRQWDEVASPTSASLMGGTVLNNGHIILTGAAGTVLESADAGLTFTTRPGGGFLPWSSVIESAHGLLLAGEAGIAPLKE